MMKLEVCITEGIVKYKMNYYLRDCQMVLDSSYLLFSHINSQHVFSVCISPHVHLRSLRGNLDHVLFLYQTSGRAA